MLPSRIFLDSLFDEKAEKDQMKCDIYEKDGVYHVEAEVPGFRKEDIKIEFHKGNLILRVESKKENNENKKYLHRERISYEMCERSFYLGEVDEENIEASFEDGVLKIKIPKKTVEEKRRMIEIQ